MAIPNLQIRMNRTYHKSPYNSDDIGARVDYEKLHKLAKGIKHIKIINLSGPGAYLQFSNIKSYSNALQVENNKEYTVSAIFDSLNFYLDLTNVKSEIEVNFDVLYL